MTSRADELAEAVEAMLRLWPEDIITGESGDPGPCAIVACRQALHRYRNSAPSEADTIKVRIAVAVSRVDGHWSCAGWRGCEDPMDFAIETLSPPEDRYYVTVRLPKPAPVPEIDDVEVELG